MAKFRYRMQNILELKNKLEEQQRMTLATARLRLFEEEEELTHLQLRKVEYEKALREASKDRLDVQMLKVLRENISILNLYIREQEKRVRYAENEVAFEEEKMVDAMRERKIQEKLRERAFDGFLKEVNYEENRTVDELVSYKYTGMENEA